jgi:hypothetical protein
MHERIPEFFARGLLSLPGKSRWAKLRWVVLALPLVPSLSTAAIITTTDYHLSQEISGWLFSEVVVQVTIDQPGSNPTLFPDDGSSVDGGIAISTADIGNTVYADRGTPEFANFVGYLTNGSDDTLGFLAGPALPFTANLRLILESSAFSGAGLTPDFAGLSIESIGIQINDLVFQPYRMGGTSFSLSATMIVSAIPEPSAALLFGIGILPVAATISRRRSRARVV